MIMDGLGLMVFFIMLDMSFRGPLSYLYYWNPVDYLIGWEYPYKVLPGTILMFLGVCLSHVIVGLFGAIKNRDRFDKYILRVMRTYI